MNFSHPAQKEVATLVQLSTASAMVFDEFSIGKLPADVYYPKEGFLPEYGVISVNERVIFMLSKFLDFGRLKQPVNLIAGCFCVSGNEK